MKEVAYHRELASEWTVRLGDGTEESARRMAEGLEWNWRFVPELFEVDEAMQAAIDAGIAPDPREFDMNFAPRSARSWPMRSWKSRRTNARFSAAAAAITASISAICSR